MPAHLNMCPKTKYLLFDPFFKAFQYPKRDNNKGKSNGNACYRYISDQICKRIFPDVTYPAGNKLVYIHEPIDRKITFN